MVYIDGNGRRPVCACWRVRARPGMANWRGHVLVWGILYVSSSRAAPVRSREHKEPPRHGVTSYEQEGEVQHAGCSGVSTAWSWHWHGASYRACFDLGCSSWGQWGEVMLFDKVWKEGEQGSEGSLRVT